MGRFSVAFYWMEGLPPAVELSAFLARYMVLVSSVTKLIVLGTGCNIGLWLEILDIGWERKTLQEAILNLARLMFDEYFRVEN